MTEPRIHASHANVYELASDLSLDQSAYRQALGIANLTPDTSEWRHYIDRFLLVIGSALILAGIAAFCAGNWADLGHIQKFALIQAGIAAAVLFTWLLKIDSPGGRASLFGGAVLVGVLLAVYGQVYQTGADPYGLFLTWAVLVLPWALIGRQAGLWFLIVVLANLTVIMYWTQVLYPPEGAWNLAQLLGPIFWLGSTVMDARLANVLFALNAVALVVWEILGALGVTWLRARWAPRVIALVALNVVVLPTMIVIIGESLDVQMKTKVLSPSLMMLAFAACFYYYQYRRHDLFILTCCAMGLILVIMTFAIRHFPDDVSSSLMLAVLLIVMVSTAAYWLRHVSRGWENEP